MVSMYVVEFGGKKRRWVLKCEVIAMKQLTTGE